MDPQTVVDLAAPTGDFSFWQLFLKADPVVKGVIICMLLSSVWCWAIAIEKTVAYIRASRDANEFERLFWSGQSLDDLYASLSQKQASSSMISLFVAAMREWRRSIEGNPKPLPGVLMRIERVMEVTVSREMDRLESRLLFLATVGSTTPFVGLFGTVWGIMNSFESIAVSKNTNLAVVAPGIAEALFATALGLAAAIPAVVFYNIFSSRITNFGQRLESFSDEFLAIVSRQIDMRGGA